MNKMADHAPYQGPPAPAAAAAAERQPEFRAEPRPAAAQAPLTEARLQQIAETLRGGELPLASRGDLIELHNRIITMFTTLNEGLGEMQSSKAAADRTVLTARIDTLEEAVNRMEGALRIEFEPALKSALAEVMVAQAKPQRRWRHSPAAARPSRQPGRQGGAAGGPAALGPDRWRQQPEQQARAMSQATAPGRSSTKAANRGHSTPIWGHP